MANIYLNNATTGFPKSNCVKRVYSTAIENFPSDIRHSSEPEVESARQVIAEILKIDSSNVFFTSDATLAINCVIQGILTSGDHCVVDNRSHNAVTRTLYGLHNVEWDVANLFDVSDKCSQENVLKKIKDSTRLVCLTHVSNVTGSIFEIRSLAAQIKRKAPNVSILVDASQSAGTTNLSDACVGDFVVFTGHKHLHSVPGAAVLIAKRKLQPVVFGGTGTFSARLSMSEYTANFIEVGTPNLPAILALTEALKRYSERAEICEKRIRALTNQLWDGLGRIPSIRRWGRSPCMLRNGTIACVVPGYPEQEWVPYLRSQGIVVRGGLHCCPLAHMGTDYEERGTLRISLSRYTTEEEISVLLQHITKFSSIVESIHESK